MRSKPKPPNRIVAIDPGEAKSGYLILVNGETIFEHGIVENEDMIGILRSILHSRGECSVVVVIERVMAYRGIFQQAIDTAVVAGRLVQVCDDEGIVPILVPRATIRAWCGRHRDGKIGDREVREEMIEVWGPPAFRMTDEEQRHLTKGKRRRSRPGPTHGIKADEWSALALATWYAKGGDRCTRARSR